MIYLSAHLWSLLTRTEQSLHFTTARKAHKTVKSSKNRPVSNIFLLFKLIYSLLYVCSSSIIWKCTIYRYEVTASYQYRSALRQLHSTRDVYTSLIALRHVQNDIQQAVNIKGRATFYLIPALHSTRLTIIAYFSILASSFGIQGKFMAWLQSYLTGHTQTAHT